MHSVSYQVAAKLYTTKVRTVALETVSNVVSSVVSRPLPSELFGNGVTIKRHVLQPRLGPANTISEESHTGTLEFPARCIICSLHGWIGIPYDAPPSCFLF